MMNLGDLTLKLAFLSGALAAVSFAGTLRRDSSSRAGIGLFAIHAGLLLVALATLAAHFLAHRFQYAYVSQYSSRALTPALTLAALWAGQEGSILLWVTLGALLGAALMLQPGPLARPAMLFVSLTQLAMMALLFARSPFRLNAVVPADGQGLNPLLEDPWMVAHPPALFVGYTAMLAPFALGAAALVRNEVRDWNRMVWPWALFAVVSLGTGIVLGGIWAYKTLGWGGYWGWDPVENASLVPWLVAVALLHGLMIQRTLGSLVRTNLLLALLGWVTVLGGTYLTRSGVLQDFSVHSFTDSGLNLPLSLMLGLTVALAVWLLALRWRSLAATSTPWIGVSRESALWLGLMTVLAFAVLVAVGTTAPLITALSGKPAGIQPGYYVRIAVPIGLGILLLMGLAPALRWVRQQGMSWVALLPPGIVAGAIALGIAVPQGLRDPVYLALVFATGFSLGVNAWTAARLFSRGWTFGAGYLGHVGVSVMALGIAVSTALGKTDRLTLPAGRAVQSQDYTLTYSGRLTDPRGAQHLRVRVEGKGLTFEARPRLMASPRGDGMIRTPAIEGWRELYLSPVEVKTIEHPLEASAAWIGKGEQVTVGGIGYTFRGFRMEGTQHLMVYADIEVKNGPMVSFASPALSASSEGTKSIPADVPGVGSISLARVDADRGRVALVTPGAAPVEITVAIIDFSTKPLVNLVWVGAILMLVGSSLAGVRRAGEQKGAAA